MTFDQAFDILLGHEGGFSNVAADPGGATMYGITEAVARQHGYAGEMRHLSLPFAKQIYRKDYWEAVRADELPAGLRYSLFDAAVNSGVGQAVRWLQRALGVAEDGTIGPITLQAAAAANAPVITSRLLGQRLQFMASLAIWQTFGRGWARRIAAILQQ